MLKGQHPAPEAHPLLERGRGRRVATDQNIAHERQGLRIPIGIPPHGLGKRPLHFALILRPAAHVQAPVDAIYPQPRHDLPQRDSQLMAGEIAPASIRCDETRQLVAKVGDGVGEHLFQYVPFRAVDDIFERRALRREVVIKPRELGLRFRRHEYVGELPDEFVARRAMRRPGRIQLFAFRQDLLDHCIERGSRRIARGTQQALQPLEILEWIPQAIDMINTQTLGQILPHQCRHQAVCFLEYPCVLHAQTDQTIDREEPAVVHFVHSGFPMREPVVLIVEHRIEAIKTAGIARPTVDQLELRGDCLSDSRILSRHLSQSPP